MLNSSALISDVLKVSQHPPSISLALNGQRQRVAPTGVCMCVWKDQYVQVCEKVLVTKSNTQV